MRKPATYSEVYRTINGIRVYKSVESEPYARNPTGKILVAKVRDGRQFYVEPEHLTLESEWLKDKKNRV